MDSLVLMNNVLVIISLFFYLTCAAMIIYYSRREGIVSTGFVIVIGSTVYYVAIPIELFLSKSEGYFTQGGIYISLPSSGQALVIFMATLAIVSFMVGYKLSGYRPRSELFYKSEASRLFRKKSPVFVSINFIMLFSLTCLIAFFREELINSFAGYELNVDTVYSNPSYSYLNFICTISTSICAFVYLCVREKIMIGLMLVLLVAAFGVALSDKNSILISLLPLVCWLCIYGYRKRGFLIVSAFIGITGSALVLILLPVFSLYRAGVDIFSIDIMKGAYYFSFTQIDPAGPFISLSETLREPGSLALGTTYLKNFAILIPKMLWANRPTDLGEQFAMDYISSWTPGRGLGYSLMSEGLANFGCLGAFLHYFIIGYIWGMGWRIIGGIIKNVLYINIFYRTIGFYLLFLMHRGASLQILKSMFHFFIPLLVVLLVVQMVFNSMRVLRQCEIQHVKSF